MLTGVVTQGTGLEAQPAGYTAAGKTGTAEKINESGTYSSTDFIASFAGFAPAEDPAVSVVVILDSPRGKHYHGGEVAAPVFARVVERTLAYMNTPRSLPVPLRGEVVPMERAGGETHRPSHISPADGAEDRLPSGDGGEGPGEFLLAADQETASRTVVLVQGDAVVVPDLLGMTLRGATERLAAAGLEPAVVGGGVAAAQRPAAGTRAPRGSRVWVEFRRSLPSAPARSM